MGDNLRITGDADMEPVLEKDHKHSYVLLTVIFCGLIIKKHGVDKKP